MAKINDNLILDLKCKEWKAVKELFKCDSVDSYSVDGKDSLKDEDYSGNAGVEEFDEEAAQPTPENLAQGDNNEESNSAEDTPESETREEDNSNEEKATTKAPKKKKIIKKKKKRQKPHDILPTPKSDE